MKPIQCLRRVSPGIALVLLLFRREATSAETPQRPHYVGSMSCNSIACHGRSEPRPLTGAIGQNEFMLWMQNDPHARSTQTIWSDKFNSIMMRLNAVRDGGWEVAVYRQCASCHDPNDQASAPGNSLEHPQFLPASSLVNRGIECESCHGAASQWLANHYRRGYSATHLATFGMTATPNLLVRSQVCAKCHVGSETNDMNHDMIAAGHPALRFEATSYHDRLAKHWPAHEERFAIPDFQAQLWAAGQLASADAALHLLHGRAARSHRVSESGANASRSPWPEFSEYSCLSCHQRLRPEADNRALRLRAQPASQPEWNPWFLVLPLERSSAGSGESLPAAFAAWGTLRTRLQPVLTTNAKDVESSTEFVRRQLFNDFGFLTTAGGWQAPPTFSQDDLIHTIRATAPKAESWESLCQIFLALQAAQRGFQDHHHRSAMRIKMNPALPRKNPLNMSDWHRNLESIRWSLAFSKGTDVPRALSRTAKPDDPPHDDVLPGDLRPMTLVEIRDLAVQLADQLAAHSSGSKN